MPMKKLLLMVAVATLAMGPGSKAQGPAQSGDEKAIILGDVTHTPAQVANPDWCMTFDVDQDLGVRTRSSVFDRIEQEGLKVAAGHYPYPGLGGIVRVEGKRRWQSLS